MTPQERAEINRNYLIRLTKNDKTLLVGAGMLSNYIEKNQLKKLIQRLLDTKTGNYTFWNRKDVTIKFLLK